MRGHWRSFQGLKTDCPWAEPIQEMFRFVLFCFSFGLNGINKGGGGGGRGEMGGEKNPNALRRGVLSSVLSWPLPLISGLIPSTPWCSCLSLQPLKAPTLHMRSNGGPEWGRDLLRVESKLWVQSWGLTSQAFLTSKQQCKVKEGFQWHVTMANEACLQWKLFSIPRAFTIRREQSGSIP